MQVFAQKKLDRCGCRKLLKVNSATSRLKDAWKITRDILWSYSASSFATKQNYLLLQLWTRKLQWAISWSINCTGTTSARSGGASSTIPAEKLPIPIENSLFQQNITLIPAGVAGSSAERSRSCHPCPTQRVPPCSAPRWAFNVGFILSPS